MSGFIKTFVILCLTVAAVFIMTLLAEPSAKDNPIAETSVISKQQSEPQPVFVMQSYGNIIGIYNYGAQNPFRLLDVTVDKLPKNDQTRLKKGIKIYSKEELTELIEDLDS